MKRFICIFLSLLLVAVMQEIAADSPKNKNSNGEIKIRSDIKIASFMVQYLRQIYHKTWVNKGKEESI